MSTSHVEPTQVWSSLEIREEHTVQLTFSSLPDTLAGAENGKDQPCRKLKTPLQLFRLVSTQLGKSPTKKTHLNSDTLGPPPAPQVEAPTPVLTEGGGPTPRLRCSKLNNGPSRGPHSQAAYTQALGHSGELSQKPGYLQQISSLGGLTKEPTRTI
jgi:hypothetical protein